MRIHIVQKGDTLWNLSKKYGVDFEQLKAANTQLSNPDMIMPGMKIKIPSAGVPVKKEQPVQKEVQKKEQPMKEQPIKEQPMPKEQPQVAPKMEMPKAPPMPEYPKQVHKTTQYDQNLNVYFYQPQTTVKKMEQPAVKKPPVKHKEEPKKEMIKPKEPLKEKPVELPKPVVQQKYQQQPKQPGVNGFGIIG